MRPARSQGLVLVLLIAGAIAARADLEPAPPGVDAADLLARSSGLLHSKGTYIQAVMKIARQGDDADRTLGFRLWTDRSGDRAFLRILEPARHAGTGFLEVQPNLWKFVPRVSTTRRVPASAMGEDWMGSDWQIRDLFSDPKQLDHYDHAVLGVDDAVPGHPGVRAYRIESIAIEASPAPWPRILDWVETRHATPLRREFYDADGDHRKTLRLGEIRTVQGREVPHSWVMVPMGKKREKKGRRSTIVITEIRFEQSFPDEIFTTRQLRSWP